MDLNVGIVGGFMRQQDRTARAYVYDVTAIVAELEHEMSPMDVLYGRMSHNTLIDGFFQWALNSFEFVGIRDFSAFDYTATVMTWFNQQERARSLLWGIFSIESQYAGHEIIVVRRRNTLWLFVLL